MGTITCAHEAVLGFRPLRSCEKCRFRPNPSGRRRRRRKLPIKPIVIRPMVKVSHHVSLFNPLRLWQPFDDAVGFHADADDAGEEF